MPNYEKDINKNIDDKNEVNRQWEKIFINSLTGSDIKKIEIDNWAKIQIESSKALLASAKMTEDIFSDQFKNLANNAINRYKRHGDKHASESAKMTKSLFSDSLGRSVESIKTKAYRDSISGLDIDIHPSNEQLKDEEKRLDELVKKILDEVKKENEKILNFKSKWDSKFSNSITGTDIKKSQLIDPWWIAYKKYIELLESQIAKATDKTNKIREEITKLIESINKIKLDRKADIYANDSSNYTARLFDESNADKIKDAEEIYTKELADKYYSYVDNKVSSAESTKKLFDDSLRDLTKEALTRYKKHGDKHASESAKMIGELFSDSFKRSIESIKTKIYRDSISGEDIKTHWTSDDIERAINKALRENLDLNLSKLNEFKAANDIAKIFDDTYIDLTKEALTRYKKHGDKHAFESAKMVAELFSDSFKRAIESIKTKIYRDSISGEDIKTHWTNDDIERAINKVLRENLDLNLSKLNEFKAANDVAKIFDDTYTDLIKEALARYKKHGDKHAFESAKMVAELFSDSFRRAIESIKTKIYRDSASGLDINIHWTKEDLDRWTSKVLRDNWDLNKGILDEIKASDITGKLFDNSYDRAMDEVKARVYRDSISGLDIELHPTNEQLKAELKKLNDEVRKYLEENLRINKAKFAETSSAISTGKLFDDEYTDLVKIAKNRTKESIFFDLRNRDWWFKDPDLDLLRLPILKKHYFHNSLFKINPDFTNDRKKIKDLATKLDIEIIDRQKGVMEIVDGKLYWTQEGAHNSVIYKEIEGIVLNSNLSDEEKRNISSIEHNGKKPTIGGFGFDKHIGVLVKKTNKDNIYEITYRLILKNGEFYKGDNKQETRTQIIDLSSSAETLTNN
ncbi:MAG6090-like repeat-containing lipoprotein [Mycoplasmopsis agalactiae]|uniref:MAG6090-like repeat-containing lipoprotein n=1 Tax=Mycoplasmopsis agalactiae TaxID=2110 RepID=UPI002F91EC04